MATDKMTESAVKLEVSPSDMAKNAKVQVYSDVTARHKVIPWKEASELAKAKFPRRRTLLLFFLLLGAASIAGAFAHTHPKNIEALKNMFESVALLVGGWWFFKHEEYKARIQFDVSCKLFEWSPGHRLAEIQFAFENNGGIEHRLCDLKLSVSGHRTAVYNPAKETDFEEKLVTLKPLVPPEYKYFFVRPGVKQIITSLVLIPADLDLIKVTGGFCYDQKPDYPHTAAHVFSTKELLPKPPDKLVVN